MPAKTKKAAAKKSAAKPAKKPAPKAAKSAVKSKSKTAPAKKSPSKSKPASPKKAATKAPKKPSPKPVKKAAPKKAPAAAKKSAPAKKTAAEKKPAAKAAPEKKAAAAPAPAKAAKPAPAPAPEPVKAAKPAASSKSSGKTPPAPLAGKGRTSISTAGTPRINRGEEEGITIEIAKGPVKMTPFLKKQKQRLVELRDAYLNSIEGVANETIRNENGDSSAFGMHQADAGSDAYDRDFALSLLGKEQDALYEINEALKRIETGTYGLCEGTGTKIPEERLEAMPFARYSVAYQEKIERSQITGRWSRPVHSLFGLDNADEAADDDKDEDEAPSSSNNSGESLDFSKE